MDRSLVINAGSSSIKFQIFENEQSVLSGLCDAIGLDISKIKIKHNGQKEEIVMPLPNHKIALEKVIEILKEKGLLEGLSRVIHRAVHGGEDFKGTALVTTELIDKMKELVPLAPLHNPANIEGMELMMELLPEVKEYAVFDTAFHSTMPEEAYLYGTPYSWYKDHGVRRYGFHGSSHQYVIKEAIKILKEKDSEEKFAEDGIQIINCHLGNGASVCASIGGKSVDTSMGMTPTDGLIMGTRCGSIDPGIIEYITNATNKSVAEVTKDLNKESGLKGISELTSDMRPLEENMHTCEKSGRAMKVYLYKLIQVVGGYAAAMGGVDAICFTGGAGEHSPVIRKYVADKLKFMGVELDEEANNADAKIITTENSKVKMFVIPTDEELQMVRNAKQIE